MREGGFKLNGSESRKLEIVSKFREGKISRQQCASLLGLSVRQVSRLAKKLKETQRARTRWPCARKSG
jgi:alkylated DNA nucleotide flippase Atl1